MKEMFDLWIFSNKWHWVGEGDVEEMFKLAERVYSSLIWEVRDEEGDKVDKQGRKVK